MEEYEPRLLYSADLAPQALLGNAAPATELRVLDASGEFVPAAQQATAQPLEMVFIDSAVEDKNSFINQIDANPNRRVEVVVLDSRTDGIVQIGAALAGRSDIAAVHIVSHGADGEIQLGGSVLDAAQLAARRGEIAQWGNALVAGADLLLYGCDVAAGSAGEAFVQQLSQLTRADVAASTDLTGSATLGGDWLLEFAVGKVGPHTLLTAQGQATWQGTLATFVVTDKNGNGPGTLSQAIADANAASGDDTIVFQLSGAGAQIINVSSVLIITDTVTIDGTINNGAPANGGLPGIILDGGGINADGLRLQNGADGSTIRGLVIRGFDGDGIHIQSNADGNTIANNHIGNLWEDGTRAGSNENTGAGIHISSRFNVIGGNTTADRNLISGNGGPGILVENPGGFAVLGQNNTIQNNVIGVEGDGVTALPNSVGIELRNGAQWDYILGNKILRNTGSGIVIGDSTGSSVHDLLVGGSAADANTIAQNGGDGVTVISGLHNTIQSNSISGNTGLGIDLRNNAAATGVTTNDGSDADGGGNELQNFPVLVSAVIESPTQIRTIGKMSSAPNADFQIEFFSNTTADASGNGEGQTYLGNATVTTNGSGDADINVLLTASVPAGRSITATATNFYTILFFPVRGSTSEFGPNVAAANNVAPVNAVPTARTVNEDTTLAITGITIADANSNLASAQLTVNNGTLNVSLSGGATISAGSNGSGNLTISGSQAAINATLASLTYRGNANYNGADTLRLFSADLASSSLSDTDTVGITVVPVNDPPASTGGIVTGAEDTPYVFAWADFNVSDVDNAITGATAVRLDALPASGTLQYFNGTVWTPVALGQLITKSSIDAGALRFVPLADESGYDGYATSGVGNLRQDYARFSFTPLHSSALTILNPDGELNGLTDGLFENPAVGWTTSGADAGAQNPTVADFSLDNDASLYVNDGATLTQSLLLSSFTAARDYSLSFEVGWRNGAAYPTEPGFRVELWAGTTLLGSMDQTSVTSIQGRFVSGVLAISGPASGATEGAQLQVRLVGTSLQANFDNLSLTSMVRATDIGVPAQMTVDITPVNDAPTATNLGAAESYTEDTALNLINIVVSDIDSSSVTATLTLSNVSAGSLNTATSGAVTSTYNAATGVWRASGAIANVNTLLAGVTFTPALNFNSSFTIATSVSDGVAAAVTGSKAMVGIAVNDAPTATNMNVAETYNEDTARNLTDIVITDVDSANVTATLTLSSAAAGSLNTATAGTVTSTYNAATGVWTASGAIANVNTLLAGLTFTPALNSSGSFSIATSVSDGVAAPITGSKAVTGTAVNDAPTATNLSAAEFYVEDTALNLTDIVVADVDSATVRVTLTLSNPAAGSLNTGTSGAVTSTYNAATGVWTANGAIVDVNTLLAGLTFSPVTNFNGSLTVATSVSDGVAPALTGTKAFTGSPVNDAPSATNLSTAETYTRNLALDLIDIRVTDPDGPTITARLTLSDVAAGTLNTATAGAVTSTFAGGVWTASGAVADVNTLLAALTFTPSLNYVSPFSIATRISDGVAPALNGSKTMTGSFANLDPGATNLSAGETYFEDAPLDLTDIVVSDPDSPNVTVTITLSNSAAGSLRIATAGAVTSTYDVATGLWVADGPITDVNALLAGLMFDPAPDFNGAFTMATSVSDGVAAPITGIKVVNGIAVNDPPATAGVTLAPFDEDGGTRLITSAELLGNASDVDSPALAVSGLTITGGAGTLVDNGNGTWRYTPLADDDGAATFGYLVSDGALATSGSATLDLTPVNDAPTNAPVTLTPMAEDSGLRLITQAELLANASDVDGPALVVTGLASSSGAGTLVDNGDGTWSYTSAANDDTAVGFSYTVSDGTLATPGSAALDITSVNDAPVSTPVTLAAFAEDSGARLITQAELLATASDVDGPALVATGLIISSGAGALLDNGNGTWRYTGAADDDTAVGFSYTVSDGTLATPGSATLDITAVNDAPVTTPVILAAIVEDSGVRLITQAELLANATDVDGPGLVATGLAINSGAGTLVDNGNGTWRYTSAVDDDTAVSFSYAVSDGTLAAAGRATLDLTPVNDAPLTTPVSLAAIDEDSGARLITQAELLANATDVDGPALVATGLTINSGAGTLVDNGNGTWTYTGAVNDDSAVAFSYSVGDGTLAAPGSASLDLTPVNDAPASASVVLAAIAEDSGARLITQAELLANATDVDGPALVATGLTISSGTGTLVDNGNGTWTYTGAVNDDSAVAFSYSVSDGTLAAAGSASLDLTPVNDAPASVSVVLAAIAEDSGAHLITQAELLGNATDVDGPSLVATGLTISSGAGTLVDNGNGTWTYTGAANDDSAVAFSYSVSDGALAVPGSASLELTPVNDVPLIGGVAAATVNEDAGTTLAAAGALTIADPDTGESSFVVQTAIPGTLGEFSIDRNGNWTYSADNNQVAIQRLAAGRTLSDTFAVTTADGTVSRVAITVLGINDAPQASDQTISVAGDTTRVLTVSDFGYSDPDGDVLAAIRVTALPTSGALLVNNVPVTLRQEISAAAIAAGQLHYVSIETVGAAASTAFAFQVGDGTTYSAASYSLSILVTPGIPRNENGVLPQPGNIQAAAVDPPLAVVSAAPAIAQPLPSSAGAGGAAAAVAPPAQSAPLLPPANLLDGPAAVQIAQRIDGFAEVPRARVAGDTAATPASVLSVIFGPGATEFRVQNLSALELSSGERAAEAIASTAFVGDLDRLRDNARADEVLERNIIVSSVATGAGMSVGYVLWLLRGGLLLTSLLSSLPAWRFVDPLPVLGRMQDDDDEGAEDDSVESMVRSGVAADGSLETESGNG